MLKNEESNRILPQIPVILLCPSLPYKDRVFSIPYVTIHNSFWRRTNFHFSRGVSAKPSSKTGLIVGLTVGFFVLIVFIAAVAVVILKR